MTGVYVHIPFCVKKCAYCDFNSYDNINDLKDSYTDAVIGEINGYSGEITADTVFFGGGTPTALGIPRLIRIIDAVKNKFKLEKCEFTVEANPATVDAQGLLLLHNAGVNRLSLGLQSCNNRELAALGRIHTYEDFLKTYRDAQNAGFENINIDIMFGIPCQTEESFADTLKTAADLNPSHISCYSLIIEENTPFYNMKLDLPDEETERRMYYTAVDFFASRGYVQYEISNFAKPGCECRHNIKYWTRANYAGFGAGACSMINNVRYKNTSAVSEYIKNNRPEREVLTKEEALAEHIFLGLRLTGGFNIAETERLYGINFFKRYGDIVEKYEKAGLLKTGENLMLTREGISVSNTVMCEFL